MGVFRWLSSQALPLVLRVQDAAHTEDVPIPLELRGQIGLGEIKPVVSSCVLDLIRAVSGGS